MKSIFKIVHRKGEIYMFPIKDVVCLFLAQKKRICN